jgi:hypothetical protein
LSVRAYQARVRQGKITLVAGVVGLLVGFVLQAVNAHRAAEAPPMMLSSSDSTALLAQIAGFVLLGGVILVIVGIVRYAQSGSALAVPPPGPTERPRAGTFCTSCGERITGKGRFCASCGTPTT